MGLRAFNLKDRCIFVKIFREESIKIKKKLDKGLKKRREKEISYLHYFVFVFLLITQLHAKPQWLIVVMEYDDIKIIKCTQIAQNKYTTLKQLK